MSKQNLTITILSLSALVLVAANFLIPPQQAIAATVIKDRLYQICTATEQQGTDAVYVLNNQTGMITCYSYDSTNRRIVNRASQSVADIFAAAPMPAR